MDGLFEVSTTSENASQKLAPWHTITQLVKTLALWPNTLSKDQWHWMGIGARVTYGPVWGVGRWGLTSWLVEVYPTGSPNVKTVSLTTDEPEVDVCLPRPNT